MKQAISALAGSRLVALAGVAVLVTAVIVLGTALAWHPGLTYGLAAGILVLAVVGWLVAQLRAAKAAAGIEAALRAQGQEQLSGARPDQQAGIEELRKQFDESLSLLRQSRLGRGALHKLPWFVIIGPPGSGKSTLLRESSLSFPYMTKGRSAIRGLGGTKNCDWWFADRGILLDTAGRYTTEYEDRDEWLSFLGMLKKGRSERPINGAIVVLSIADVVGGNETEVRQHADNVRDRIDELTRTLDVVFPVYLVFTKCDRLGGFVPFFETMNQDQRRQVWGFTLAYRDGRATDLEQAFDTEFALLEEALGRRRLEQVGSDLTRRKKHQVYTFPLQFAATRARLRMFVGLLQQANPYQEVSPIRGCYFTSGTQEGTVINQLTAQIFEIADMEIDVPEDERRCYFVDDVFNRVIFPDSELAEPTAKAMQRRRINRWLQAAGLAAAAVAIGWFALARYLDHRSHFQAVGELAQRARAVTDGTPMVEKLAVLDDLRAMAGRAGEHGADEFVRLLQAEYAARLGADLVYPVGRSMEAEIAGAAQRPFGEALPAFAELATAKSEQLRFQQALQDWQEQGLAQVNRVGEVLAAFRRGQREAGDAILPFWNGLVDAAAAGVDQRQRAESLRRARVHFDAWLEMVATPDHPNRVLLLYPDRGGQDPTASIRTEVAKQQRALEDAWRQFVGRAQQQLHERLQVEQQKKPAEFLGALDGAVGPDRSPGDLGLNYLTGKAIAGRFLPASALPTEGGRPPVGIAEVRQRIQDARPTPLVPPDLQEDLTDLHGQWEALVQRQRRDLLGLFRTEVQQAWTAFLDDMQWSRAGDDYIDKGGQIVQELERVRNLGRQAWRGLQGEPAATEDPAQDFQGLQTGIAQLRQAWGMVGEEDAAKAAGVFDDLRKLVPTAETAWSRTPGESRAWQDLEQRLRQQVGRELGRRAAAVVQRATTSAFVALKDDLARFPFAPASAVPVEAARFRHVVKSLQAQLAQAQDLANRSTYQGQQILRLGDAAVRLRDRLASLDQAFLAQDQFEYQIEVRLERGRDARQARLAWGDGNVFDLLDHDASIWRPFRITGAARLEFEVEASSAAGAVRTLRLDDLKGGFGEDAALRQSAFALLRLVQLMPKDPRGDGPDVVQRLRCDFHLEAGTEPRVWVYLKAAPAMFDPESFRLERPPTFYEGY